MITTLYCILQHSATHCNTLQRGITRHTSTHWEGAFKYSALHHRSSRRHSYVLRLIHIYHDSFIRAMTHSYVTGLIHTCHDAFTCAVTRPYVPCLRWMKVLNICIYICIYIYIQSWMTNKKTEISAQHEFLKPIYLCVHRGIVLIYLDVHQKC